MAEAKAPARRSRAPKDRTPAKAQSTEIATLDSLIEEGRRVLAEIVALEDGPKDKYVTLAQTLINIRRHFKSPGREFPDWRGRSHEYRTAAAKVYEAAEIPPDSEGSIQARIRYVLNNELRQVAPPEDLEALGYKKRNQAERAADRRAGKKRAPLDAEGPTLTAPGSAPITTRAEAFRAIRMVVEGPIWDLPVPSEGDEYVEYMRELTDTVKLLEQLWALHEQRRSMRRNTIELASTYAATATKRPTTKEEMAAIRQAASQEARYLSAPPPAELDVAVPAA